MKEMMDILITGGAGFIGGYLAERFARDGHSVVVFDNFDAFHNLDIKEHNVESGRDAARENDGEYKLVNGDVRDAELVTNLVSDVE